MASYNHVFEHKKARLDSPAKVFAKLKSKLNREANDPPFTGEKHGADVHSPRRRKKGSRGTSDEENQSCGSHGRKVQALTLSPITSAEKTFCYPFSNIDREAVEEMHPQHAFMSSNERTARKRTFMESTAVCHSYREQIHAGPHHDADLEGFKMFGRSPGKMLFVGSDCERDVFEKDHYGSPSKILSPSKVLSPSKILSPRKQRLRKIKSEQHDLNEVNNSSGSSCVEEANSDVTSQIREMKTASGVSEDNIHDVSCLEGFADVRGFTADQSQMTQETRDPVFPPPRSIAARSCCVMMEKIPVMSPAKMFALMKEREKKCGRKKDPDVCVVSSSTRQLFKDGNDFHENRESPLSTLSDMAEIEETACSSAPDSVDSVSCSREKPAGSHFDCSEDVQISAAPPQMVLLEDPLVLNSPQISIPKKQAEFQHNKWSQHTKFPNDSVIYLKNWFLRKHHKGLFVDGIHREDNIPWNSNIIVDRISNSVLKTVSSRIYILVGKMNLSVHPMFPRWFWKKFVNGFPPNWKSLYEKLLSESRDDSGRTTERTSKRKATIAKTKSEASSTLSVKHHTQKRFKTPDSCPPTVLSSANKVSRSGRLIKPPLEYWKGGRVILDADMNVTIHECYDTSVCIPEVTKKVSASKSQKPSRVILPEGQRQSDSACNDALVPLRKVKASSCRPKQAKVIPKEKPSNQPASSVETNSCHTEWSGRITRSSKRSPSLERTMYVDTVPQKQRQPKKAKTQTLKKTILDINNLLERKCKQTVRASAKSPTVNDKTLQQMSSDEFSKRQKQRRGKNRKSCNKSQPNRTSPSSQTSESSAESTKRRTRKQKTNKSNGEQTITKHKPSKSTGVLPSLSPLSKSTCTSKTHKANKHSTVILPERDEDEWTEAELMMLQEAVSCYPKHVSGYWAKVAKMVGSRSAEECHSQHTSLGKSQTPVKKVKKPRKEKAEAPKDPVTDHPIISAKPGTFKRKQQVRQFLETMPRDDVDDVFSTVYMQNKRFEIPSMCPSEDQEFSVSEMEPLTPKSNIYPEVKTPQCLHITPGMMSSTDKDNNDKYVYQLQRRTKKNQLNFCKQTSSLKKFTPTPSVKRTMRRCGNAENDTFAVWEMFPGNDLVTSDSGDEEDFYFDTLN